MLFLVLACSCVDTLDVQHEVAANFLKLLNSSDGQTPAILFVNFCLHLKEKFNTMVSTFSFSVRAILYVYVCVWRVVNSFSCLCALCVTTDVDHMNMNKINE